VSEPRIAELTAPGGVNPRDAKEELARTIITQYHSADAAESAAQEFRRVFGGGGTGLPDDIPEVAIPAGSLSDGKMNPIDLITLCFGGTRTEARRLIDERGAKLNGVSIEDYNAPIAIKSGDVLQRGKRKFARLRLP
jgi:tyrosyl-tRNA synthetase